MERFLELWGKLPTTQARVTITLFAVIATALRYVVSGALPIVAEWEPSYEWLGFLLLMSGVDAMAFFAKRSTDIGYVSAKMGNPQPPPPAADSPSKE